MLKKYSKNIAYNLSQIVSHRLIISNNMTNLLLISRLNLQEASTSDDHHPMPPVSGGRSDGENSLSSMGPVDLVLITLLEIFSSLKPKNKTKKNTNYSRSSPSKVVKYKGHNKDRGNTNQKCLKRRRKQKKMSIGNKTSS